MKVGGSYTIYPSRQLPALAAALDKIFGASMLSMSNGLLLNSSSSVPARTGATDIVWRSPSGIIGLRLARASILLCLFSVGSLRAAVFPRNLLMISVCVLNTSTVLWCLPVSMTTLHVVCAVMSSQGNAGGYLASASAPVGWHAETASCVEDS